MQEVSNPEGTPGETKADHIIAMLELIAITQLRQLDLLMHIAGGAPEQGRLEVILEQHSKGKIVGDMPYMDQSG